ncbi:hypothetical protein D915_008297 [Fasciola hepatica]|uniref:Uncharacterized protein n=1 Tax=Fasciola hepatica TaxID=6192 RepID=A0A4E0RHQ6_FASHE|nr:hypothetical protein D915_008297 [Fasciola hepatica]
MNSSRCGKEILFSCALAGTGMICAGTYLDWIKIQAVVAGCGISVVCILLFPSNEGFWIYLINTERLLSWVKQLNECDYLGSLVFILILCCLLCGKDPDNIAPPAAAALGDFATVTVLMYINRLYISFPSLSDVVAVTFALFVLISCPLYLQAQNGTFGPSENRHMAITWHTFANSFGPLFTAIIMSSLSGQVLAHFSHKLPNLARLQIAINGVGGCFGSVVISRMITRLHAREKVVVSPPADRKFDCDMLPNTEYSEYQQSHGIVVSPPYVVSHLSAHSTHTLQSSFQAAPEVEEDAHRISQFILWACVPIHFGLALIFILLKFAKWIVLRYWRYLLLLPRMSTSENSSLEIDQSTSLASLDLTAVALTTGLGDLIGTLCLVFMLCMFQS